MPYPWIILARVTMDGIRATGRTVWRDGYQRAEIVPAPEAKALTWTYTETEEAARPSAERYAQDNGYIVLVYPHDEPDPLSRARDEAMMLFRSGARWQEKKSSKV